MKKTEFIPAEGTIEEQDKKIDQMNTRLDNQIKQQEVIHERIEKAKQKVKDLELQHKIELDNLEAKRNENKAALEEKRLDVAKERRKKLSAIRREDKRVAQMKPRTAKERQINVAAICEDLGCNPVEILAHIAMGDNKALKTNETIRVFERRAAATELLSYSVPKLKAREATEIEEEIPMVGSYAPRRGLLDDSMIPTELLEEDDAS